MVATGVANRASVRAALVRAGARSVEDTLDPEVVRAAPQVVLPGVGAFGAGMSALRAAGVVDALRERIAAGRPTLAVCLGLQLLAAGSDESPGVAGLGVFDQHVRRLPSPVRVPHLGWNGVQIAGGRWICPGVATFAHSFALTEAPPGWTAAWADHGGRFVAAVERGSVLGCQFHPELSGEWGARLLERWVQARPLAPSGPVRRRVVPCLDVDAGRVVKGVRFAGLRDAGDPVERARAYVDQGADELVMLDVSATPDGRRTSIATVAALREVLPIPLTVGGGVRGVDDASRLLAAGADKVAVNSAAVDDPSLLAALADRFGRQCVVLALDAARRPGGWEVVVRSGKVRTGHDAVAWASRATGLGAGEVLLTSWDRDGTGDGYDLPLITAVAGETDVPIVASGGAAHSGHLAEAFGAGADAALVASIVHDGRATVGSLKAELLARGVEVRP
ncbi:MAG: imidazole glycerol phosphate synthase subunit HisH [Myxococcota bacterium]